MSFWSNKVWHHSVRQKLGEDLVYYKVRLRRLIISETSGVLGDLLSRERIESVRAFVVFGANDLLFRAWLHPRIAKPFKFALGTALQADSSPEQFTVHRIWKKSYSYDQEYTLDEKVCDDFVWDAQTIRSIQTGENEALFDQLRALGLVKLRPENARETLRFFIAIRSRDKTDSAINHIANVVAAELKDRAPSVTMPAIYSGEGFADVLLKGEVIPEQYFAIGQLTRWITNHFRQYEVSTETLLTDSPDQLLARDDVIDDRTFLELRGRDPVVQAIIPDVFRILNRRSDEIFRFLSANADNCAILTRDERKLVHDYLSGYLNDNVDDCSVALVVYFLKLEHTLRDAFAQYAVRNRVERQTLYKLAGVTKDQSRPDLSLGDLLSLCSKIIELANVKTKTDLKGGWHEVAFLRNKPSHGEFIVQKWQEYLETFLRHLPRLREMVTLMLSPDLPPPVTNQHDPGASPDTS